MRTLATAAAAGLLVVTAACGVGSGSDADDAPGTSSDTTSGSLEDTEDTEDTESTEGGDDGGGGFADCSAIWVDGEQLPADYGGCTQDDGSIAGSSWVDCQDGSKLYTHDDVAFFTLADGTIVATEGQSSDHPGYKERSAAC